MRIEELGERDREEVGEGERLISRVYGGRAGMVDAKRAAVGVGARILFYPTLMYNVLRNMIQSEFHWWDRVDEFLLLGAVPFPGDVPRLKQVGVRGVITLNEPFETLVPTSLYLAHGIEHLLIPTRDYLFAPSFKDIWRAVEFIHSNTNSGEMTYVHCKAGRGRSTTIVLCYLVQHKGMTPTAAYEYVKAIRPRVLLSSAQWKAVQDYHHFLVKIGKAIHPATDLAVTSSSLLPSTGNFIAFDEASFIVVSRSDLDGYDENTEGINTGNALLAELRLVCRVQFVGQAALTRLSYFCIRYNSRGKPTKQYQENHSRLLRGITPAVKL